MLRVVVMLEDNLLLFNAVVPDRTRQIVLEDFLVEVLVKCVVYFDNITNALVRYAAPKLDVATAMLDRFLDMARLDRLCVAFPRVFSPIRAKPIDLGLVRPDDASPVVLSPVLVSNGPSQSVLHILRSQVRLFGLDNRTKTLLVKRAAHCIDMHRHPEILLKRSSHVCRRFLPADSHFTDVVQSGASGQLRWAAPFRDGSTGKH